MKTIINLVIAFLLGLGMGIFGPQMFKSSSHGNLQQTVTPADLSGITDSTPRISQAEAKTHRERHYENLNSVEDVVSLPTDFSETEALYAIAGRAGKDELIVLIQQAMALSNRFDRRAALQILYGRFIEIDPAAALDYLDQSQLDIDQQLIRSMFYSLAKADLNQAVDLANAYTNVRRRRIAGGSVLRAISELAPHRLEQVASTLADHHRVDQYKATVLSSLASVDPYAAAEKALAVSGTQRYRSIRSVASVWGRTAPEQALGFATNITNKSVRDMFLNSVIHRWVADDPEGAVQVLLAYEDPVIRSSAITAGLASLASTVPDQALLLADQLGASERQKAYQSIFAGWANTDVRGAAEAVAILPGHASMDVLSQVAYQYASQHPDEALVWMEQLPANQRRMVAGQVVSVMAQSDPETALAYISGLDANTNPQVLAQVVDQIARHQPQVAASYVKNLTPGSQRDQLMLRVARNWAHQDPDGALAWVSSVDPAKAEGVMREIVPRLAMRDPDLAATMLDRATGEARSQWISNIAAGYANRDAQTALTFLEQYKNEPVYEQAVAGIVPHLAHRDPQQAMNIVMGLGEDQQHLVGTVIGQWGEYDLEGARRWLQNASPEVRAQGVGALAGSWAQHDYQGALSWVSGLPQDQTRDQALAALVTTAPSVSQARSVFSRIDSQDARSGASMALFYKFLSVGDRAAARRFANDSAVSDDMRQRMLSILKNPNNAFGVF